METEKKLKDHELTDLITWRNSARKRVVEREELIRKTMKLYDHHVRALDKLKKNNISDLKWLARLNHTLARKVF